MIAAVETYQSVVSNKLRRFAARLVPTKMFPRMRLTIQTGLHEGYATTIESGSVTIGSSPECDIVLLDNCIADTHATLRFDTTILGDAVRATSTASDIVLAGASYSAQVTSPFETAPTQVQIGDVKIGIETDQSSKTRFHSRRTKPGLLNRLTKFCGIAVVLLFVPVLFSFGTPQRSLLTLNHGAPPSIGTAPLHTIEESVAALRKQLDEKGLATALKVQQETPTTIIIEGKLPENKMAAWQSVHKWFDERPHNLLLTSLVKSEAALDNFPAISSIRLSPNPQVNFANGTSMSVGDAVVDGWTIETLSETELTLVRNDERVVIDF